jgi:CheY-like chemotaxis protein
MKRSEKKILVVDDGGPVVVLCLHVLQTLGHAVKGAPGAEAALALIEKEPFDLIVVDYKMPHMNGFEFLEQARQISPALRSILITGQGTRDVVKEATTHGVDAVLLKPFTSNELRETAEQVLARPGPS